MEKFEEVRAMLHSGLQELSTNWEEIGFDENALSDRKRTVYKVLSNLIDQMTTEEKGIKKKLVDDAEAHLKLCDKLSKEMAVRYV